MKLKKNRWLRIGRRATKRPAVAKLKGNIGEQILINGVSFRLVSMSMDRTGASTITFYSQAHWIAENTVGKWAP